MKLVLSLIFFFASAGTASAAVCPPCTDAVGAVIDLARKTGLHDAVIGLWFGALLVVIYLWLAQMFKKNNWKFPLSDIVLLLIPAALVYLLYDGKMMYISRKILFLSMDEFLFSTIVGAVLFYCGGLIKIKSKSGFWNSLIVLILVSVLFAFFPPVSW